MYASDHACFINIVRNLTQLRSHATRTQPFTLCCLTYLQLVLLNDSAHGSIDDHDALMVSDGTQSQKWLRNVQDLRIIIDLTSGCNAISTSKLCNSLEIINELPIGFPISNIISLNSMLARQCNTLLALKHMNLCYVSISNQLA